MIADTNQQITKQNNLYSLKKHCTAAHDTICNSNTVMMNGTCVVNCSKIFQCTDRNIIIDPTIVDSLQIPVGTLSGYGTYINIGLNNSNYSGYSPYDRVYIYNYSYNDYSNSLNIIDIDIDVSSSYGTGYSLDGMVLQFIDKNLTLPINLYLNCDTIHSCHDSVFEMSSLSNITLLCTGNDTCQSLDFNPSDDCSLNILHTINILCSGNNSCENIDIQRATNKFIAVNTFVTCIGYNSCHNMAIRSINFEIDCIGDSSCDSLKVLAMSHLKVPQVLDGIPTGDIVGQITCTGRNSCTDAEIDEVDSLSTVIVECNGYKSCGSIYINQLAINNLTKQATSSSTSNQTLRLNCNGTLSCHEFIAYCPFMMESKS